MNKINKNNDINVIIAKGNLQHHQKFSVMKLLDWRVGNAIAISFHEDGSASIEDCPSELAEHLTIEMGGGCIEKCWQTLNADVPKLTTMVKNWVNK